MKRYLALLLLSSTALAQEIPVPYGIFGGSIPSTLLPDDPPALSIAFTNDLGMLQFNGSAWVPFTSGSSGVQSITAGSGLSGGTITTNGTISLNGSSVRYSTGSTVSPAPAYTDNGNIIIQCGSGSWTATLPAISAFGTSNAITPGGFQAVLDNPTNAQGVSCSGTGSLTATTSTLNGSSSAISIALGTAVFIAADNSTAPPGNYIVAPWGGSGGGGATLGANTFTGNQTLQYAGPLAYFDDTGSGTNGGWWSLGTATTTGNFVIAALNDALSTTHAAINIQRLTDSSASLQVISLGNTTDAPRVDSYGNVRGALFYGTSSFGTPTVPGTGGYCYSPTTNNWTCGTNGASATNIDANQNFDTYGSRVALGSVPTLTPTSNCTSFSSVTGGAAAFSWTQTSATTGVCAFTVTWSSAQAAPNGWVCNGSEASQGTTLFQTNGTLHTLYATMKTGATTANGDLYVLHCDAF
jgi:hypothetical protein